MPAAPGASAETRLSPVLRPPRGRVYSYFPGFAAAGRAVSDWRRMELLLDPLMFFASFSAMAILLASAAVAALWTALSFLRAIFGLPRGLRELRTRPRKRRALQAELNLLKRAGV